MIADLQIFRPAGDRRWAYRFRVPEGVPGPRRPMGRGFATRREARAAAEERLRVLDAARIHSKLPTVSEVIADHQLLRPGKGGGRERVDWALAKIAGRFGDTPMADVTSRDVDVWIASLDTPSTRFEVSRVFRQLFIQAGRHFQLANPVSVTPQPTRAEVLPFTDLAELERVAVELGEWGASARFVAATGMRPEEWIPLEHSDVDQAAKTVTVRRTYTEGKGLEQFVGKTTRSMRTIPLSAGALSAYRAQLVHSGPDLVFPAARGGYVNLRNWRARDWHPALDAAGVQPRGPNALRHTFATWFLLHSDDRWLLAQLMGTGVDMIEQHYGHMLAAHATRSRDILDAIWDGFGRDLDATSNGHFPPDPPVPVNQAENREAL